MRVRGHGGHFLFNFRELGRIRLGRLVAAMEDGDGVRNAWDEGMHGEAVGTDVDAAASRTGEIFAQAVSLVIGERKLAQRHFKSNMAQIVDRGDAVMHDLVDVECELGLDMLVLSLGVGHNLAVFCAQLWELNGDREIGGLRMTHRVSNVMGERADGEGKLIGVARVAEEVDDEIPGADIVGEVGERFVAKGVIADVLDDASTVGVGAGMLQLGGGERWIAAEQEGNDGILPGEIDEHLMRQQGIRGRAPLAWEHQQQHQHHDRS